MKVNVSKCLVAMACLLALGLSAARAQTAIEMFEFADSTVNAQAGVAVTPYGSNTAVVDSATGADATQGTYALRADLSFGTDAWNDIRLGRTLATTVTLASPLSLTQLAQSSVLIDLKGDVALGNKTLIVYLLDSDGERYRYISATDAAVKTATYSTDYSIAFADKDPWGGTTVDSILTEVTGVEILLQDESTGTGEPVESGTLYMDNLRLVEPSEPVSTFRTITADGDVADWDGIPAAASDVSGDGGTGRDIKAIYLANDNDNLYVRIESYNSDGFDGNEFMGLDGDNNTATGFSLFGLGLGSDTLVAGASVYSEAVGNFNSGAATPASVVSWGPYDATTDVELAIALNTTITGDITQSFPGGLGSVIAMCFGDGNAGAGDTVGPFTYTLQEGTPVTGGILEDFEFADSTVNAQAGVTATAGGLNTIAVDSGSGADATEGSYSLKAAITFDGTPWTTVQVARTRSGAYELSQTYGAATTPAISSLLLKLDVKGAPSFGTTGTDATNLFILLSDADGDIFRFINFTEASLASSTFVNDLQVAYYDTQGTGDGQLSQVTGVTVLFENPFSVAKSGTIVMDNLRLIEPSDTPVEGVNYLIPLIDPAQAPNVTDTTFDAIYDNGGVHPVISGDDWKDWAQRSTDPYAAIGDPIASVSKAYLISDGTYLYFGMQVYDPNTSAMTADTGDDTFTKWNVEDIEVGFSAVSGTAGAADAAKFSMDAFGHIDDMIPDGATGLAVDTTAKTQHNSYVIDTNTWAMEFKVALSELVGNTALVNPLPAAPGPWYGHIGYQSPWGSTPRVPLYAAGHGNGFANFTIVYDLTNLRINASSNWQLFE